MINDNNMTAKLNFLRVILVFIAIKRNKLSVRKGYKYIGKRISIRYFFF